MSLTSILTSKGNQKLRDKLKTEFKIPKQELNTSIYSPPLTKNYGTIGTAFDYLVRFYVEFINKGSDEVKKWVSEMALDQLISILSKGKPHMVVGGYRTRIMIHCESLIKVLSDKFQETTVCYQAYLKNGVMTDKLIEGSIFLAKLDLFYRTGIVDDDYERFDSNDIVDLRNLYNNLNENSFRVKKKYALNPTFGLGTQLVRGADADLILDKTLIDIKVTKDMKLSRAYLNQVIMYYVLSLIGGVNGKFKKNQIKNLGIYFARQGLLWQIPVDDIADKDSFLKLKQWFLSFMEDEYGIEI
jgi:hypothetical protein|tara:strand:+ start:361 stop:1260 length:900 start_codon:yes stop_codon:yes gene_type:complete